MKLDARLQRLERLEHAHEAAERVRDRANRARLAQFFAEEGDPRAFPDFGEISPEFQARWTWLYLAWQTTPDGFIDGLLPEHLAPEVGAGYIFFPPVT